MAELAITNDFELEILYDAIQANVDFLNDVITDGFYFSAQEVRELARKSDEEIENVLNNMRREVDHAIDKYNTARILLERIEHIKNERG